MLKNSIMSEFGSFARKGIRLVVAVLSFAGIMECVAAAQSWQGCETAEDVVAMYPEKVEELFASLDLNRQGLPEVGKAWKQGYSAKACRLLLDYFRQNEAGERFRAAEWDFEVKAVEHAMRDELIASGIWVRIPRQEDGGIDWSYRGPPGYNNNQMGQINRHSWMMSLLFAGLERRNEAYLGTLDLYIRDWCTRTERHQQFLTGETNNDSWPRPSDRKLNTGIRLRDFWPTLFYTFQQSARFRESTQILMLWAFVQQGEYMRHHHAAKGNHLVMELVGLLNLTAAFPEFRESDDWQDHAVEVLGEQFREQFYPDGMQKELCHNYHWIVVRDMERFVDLLDRTGRKVDPYFPEMVEKGYARMAFALKPNGHVPMLNDINDEGWMAERLVEKWAEYQRPDWLYAATAGAEGERPGFKHSIMFPWSGRLISRDDWSRDAQWSVFDMGPHGIGHQHNDKLHLSIHAHGRDLLTDSGRYTYKNYNSEAPRDLRGYVRRSWGHNVILVDHQSQNDEDYVAGEPLTRWAVEEEYDFAMGSFDKGWYGGIEGKHERAVVYLRGNCWVVVDRIALEKPGLIQALWHFRPDASTAIDRNGSVRTVDAGEGNLRLIPVAADDVPWSVSVVKGQTEPYFQGWFSPVQNEIYPSPCAIYEREVDRTAMFAWVITTGLGEPADLAIGAVELEGAVFRLKLQTADSYSSEIVVDFEGATLKNHHSVVVKK